MCYMQNKRVCSALTLISTLRKRGLLLFCEQPCRGPRVDLVNRVDGIATLDGKIGNVVLNGVDAKAALNGAYWEALSIMIGEMV